MGKWKGIVGKSFSPEEFDCYCHSLTFAAWWPSFVVLHNTGIPTLAQRPNGLTLQHILGLEAYYRDELGWSAGPHLFIDDRKIWVFSPLTAPGVHSPSWNGIALGVEMLGDYGTELFASGRGLQVHTNAIRALATLHMVLGLKVETLHFHKEDPKTTHKSCPGKNVVKSIIIQEVSNIMTSRAAETKPVLPEAPPEPQTPPASKRIIKLTHPFMTGADVDEVLALLSQRGYYSGKLDGQYGPLAEAAVRQFQHDYKLGYDGKVGTQTRAALGMKL